MNDTEILEEIKRLEQNKDLLCAKSTRTKSIKGRIVQFGICNFVNQWTGLRYETFVLPMAWTKKLK